MTSASTSRYRVAAGTSVRPKAATKPGEKVTIELSAPVPPRLIITEPTIEALVKSLCYGLPSMGSTTMCYRRPKTTQ